MYASTFLIDSTLDVPPANQRTIWLTRFGRTTFYLKTTVLFFGFLLRLHATKPTANEVTAREFRENETD